MSDKDTKEVCKIININEDACEFYKSAQEKTDNPDMKKIFKNFENLHNEVIVNLQDYVRENGDDPEAENTFTGQVSEMWGRMKATLSNDVDESLIASLEEAEDRCIHSIDEAIQDGNVSPSARAALKREQGNLHKSHDYMKIMKDNAQAV
jgi:uncharacterized protein (TIGR02284 family)